MKDLITLYKKYLSIALGYKRLVIIAATFEIILLIINNLSTFAVGGAIDNLKSETGSIENSIIFIAAVMCLPIIIDPITLIARQKIFAYVIRDLTRKAYESVLNLDYEYHTKKQTGKIISIILNAKEVAGNFCWALEWFVVENLGAVLVPIILLFIIDLRIGALVLATLMAGIPLFIFALRKNLSTRAQLRTTEYAVNSVIVDGITNFETVRSFGRESAEVRHLDQFLEESTRNMIWHQYSFRLLDFITRMNGFIMFFPTAFLSIWLYQNRELSIGSLVIVIMYIIQLCGKLFGFVFSLRDVIKNLPTAEDIFNLTEEKNRILETGNPIKLDSIEGHIHFNNVSFKYEERNENVLENINIDIDPDQIVAFVGPSGGGKSTLIKLLMRYYDVQGGSIEIDGNDIRKISRDSLKTTIGLVPQEPVLFNKSLLFNIGYAISTDLEEIKSHMDEIENACKRAQIYDFINSLPDKFDTIVGERGIKLSGGQKQRIAIARVLIKDPEIIIFDEATSMLDSESEMAIQKAFKELSRNKTMIIIAHRLSTIVNCDKIFVVDKGKLVEEGTHDKLINRRGVYAKLWEIQSGGFKR